MMNLIIPKRPGWRRRYDGGGPLNSDELNRRDFTHPAVYQDFYLPVNFKAGQLIETRLYWYGDAYVSCESVRIKQGTSPEWVLPAKDLHHATGSVIGGFHWETQPGRHVEGYALFGPFFQVGSSPAKPGPAQVIYRLRIDNAHADHQTVARVEVFDQNAGSPRQPQMLLPVWIDFRYPDSHQALIREALALQSITSGVGYVEVPASIAALRINFATATQICSWSRSWNKFHDGKRSCSAYDATDPNGRDIYVSFYSKYEPRPLLFGTTAVRIMQKALWCWMGFADQGPTGRPPFWPAGARDPNRSSPIDPNFGGLTADEIRVCEDRYGKRGWLQFTGGNIAQAELCPTDLNPDTGVIS